MYNRKLSQNFLIDLNVIKKLIASADLEESDTVLEIGPGKGAITERIPTKTIAVEKDKNLALLLREKSLENVEIILRDFLDYELPEPGLVVIGNIPFKITTPILEHLFFSKNRPKRICILVQKEMAERLSAKPGTKSFGALTVFGQLYADVEYLFTVKSSCFWPKPKVDAAAIKLTPKTDVPIKDPKQFSQFIKSLFSRRRKMLSTSLTAIWGKEKAHAALEKANVDGSKRCEELTLMNFVDLYFASDEG